MRRSVTRMLAELADAAVTYQEVGATRDTSLPVGYGYVHRDVAVGTGRAVFDRAVAGLFDWRMHQLAGLSVASSGGRAGAGIDVILQAGWGPLRLIIPCRVVYAVHEAGRCGFAYGTLPGHPEQGEEAFMVVLTNGGKVRLSIPRKRGGFR